MRQGERGGRFRFAGRRSVSSLVALKLVLVVVLSCLVPIPVVYLTTRAEWSNRLQGHADEMVESLARSLELPLWEIDEEGRRSVVRAYVESGAAARIRVWDTDGTLLEEWGSSQGPDLVVRRRTVRHQGTEVGTVEVGVSPRFMTSAGRRILWSNVLVMLVVALSIAGGAFLLVRRHIRRPLEALGQALDRLAEGDYDFDPADRMPWEFRSVIERFRRMARRIREREAALAEVNRRLEHEVEERVWAEERYRALFENAVEGMFVSTAEGRYVAANPALADLYGYDSPEALVQSVRDIRTEVCMFPEQRDEFLSLLERYDVVRNFEMKARRRDGKGLDLLVSARAGRGPNGRIETIQGFVLDVTHQRAMEAQMLHAQKMEAVGTLAGGVAHDFNNLLQAVLGHAEILLEARPDDPALVRGLEGIRRAALRGRSLTEQLLAFSRRAPEGAEAGDRKPLDLNRSIRSVFELLGRTLPRMIRMELDLEEPLWKVRADPVQVEQVIMNLALNAKDAMPEGGVLTVRTRNLWLGAQSGPSIPADLPPGRYVRASLSDTGHGMPAHVLEHVFEPFFTTKEVGQGTGLGLSSVYGIVKGHGGAVVCDSAPGQGTVFHVFLPAAAEEEPPAEAATGPGDTEPRGGGTVLVVDDDESVREVCQEVLGRAGYVVITAPDGETALEVYREQGDGIDVVVLDVNMPGMGGARCLEELLRQDPDARVVVATGYLDTGSPEDPCGKGACEVLRKPYRVIDLVRAVHRALGEKAPAGS